MNVRPSPGSVLNDWSSVSRRHSHSCDCSRHLLVTDILVTDMSAPHEHPVPDSSLDDDNQSPGDRNGSGIRCSKCNCLLLRQGHGSKVQLKVCMHVMDRMMT